MPSHDRMNAAKLDDLRPAQKRRLMVCGVGRSDATRATLNGGLAMHFRGDHALARALPAS